MVSLAYAQLVSVQAKCFYVEMIDRNNRIWIFLERVWICENAAFRHCQMIFHMRHIEMDEHLASNIII